MDIANDIFVISDLHIGDGGPRDNFGYEGSDRPGQIADFLDYVKKHDGELIIIGDLFDFWQANFSRVLTNNFTSRLIKTLGDMKVTYVVGNHDIDLVGFVDQKLLSPALFQALSAPFSRKIGDKTFYFMHGHEIDPYNKDEVPGKGRLLTIFAGMAETFVGSPKLADGRSVEVVLEQTGEGTLNMLKTWGRRVLVKILLLFNVQSNDLSPAQNPDRAAEMLLNYKVHKEQNGYDIAIVGHTHQPGRMGGWYFNTGSWATTDNNFVCISPYGDVQVFNWNNGNPQTNDTVLSLPKIPVNCYVPGAVDRVGKFFER
jgi:UDP-2,3-diacylglucosamine pyrophosphatase LpxH